MLFMKVHQGVLAALLLLLPGPVLRAQDASVSIRKVLAAQVAAWNRGDLPAFMQGYKNAPDTTFIGRSIQYGWQQVLDRYQRSYPTKENMGTLDFSEIQVRPLGPDYAVVTGKYHLARSAEGGGEASGIFSLVWEKTAQGWKIILDHTS
jgi:uncharacterized protein (TIGR02246 family)